MENQTLKIKTPAGYIIVTEKGDYDEYPGVAVYLSEDGEVKPYPEDSLIAWIEYNTAKERIQTDVYSADSDDPVCIVTYPDGEILYD